MRQMMFLTRVPRLLLLALAVVALTPAAWALQDVSGQTSGGAHYRFMVPDDWVPADGLVIWNHGFSLSPISPLDGGDMGPLVDVQLAEGYAVAASSYSLTGWAVFETIADLEEMVAEFEAAFGVPTHVLIYGASLGGIVTAQAVEQAELGNVLGAYPICGAVAGSRAWEGGVDLRLLYDEICGGVPGAAIPGGAAGLPFPPDPAFDDVALAVAVNACTGILTPAGLRTPEQAANLATLLTITQLPESFLLTDMGFVTFGLADLVYDPRKLGGAIGVGNANVDYGNAVINAAIERVEPDPEARLALQNHYTPTGEVGDVKIVSIHTDKDGLVLVEHESDYASKVPAQNLTTAIIVEDAPTHCGFTAAETAAGWEALRGWVAGGPQPSVAAIQGTCDALVGGGLATGPCRFDPSFVIPDIASRIRPRNDNLPPACVPDLHTLCLGDNARFQVRVTWQDFEGDTGRGNSIIESEDTGAFWFFDAGNLELVVKVLDGRPNNGRFWVFYGSLTNVAFTMTVTDTATGDEVVYNNPLGTFASVGDTDAF